MSFLRSYGLSITLAGLWLVSWLIQTVSGWVQFVAQQTVQGSESRVFGPDGYIWSWMQATFENNSSEFLQLLTFVVLTSFLIHRGSHESRDSTDRMEAKIDRIERLLRDRG